MIHNTTLNITLDFPLAAGNLLWKTLAHTKCCLPHITTTRIVKIYVVLP